MDMLRIEQQKLESELLGINRKLQNLSADLSDTEHLITVSLDIAQHIGTTYQTAP